MSCTWASETPQRQKFAPVEITSRNYMLFAGYSLDEDCLLVLTYWYVSISMYIHTGTRYS